MSSDSLKPVVSVGSINLSTPDSQPAQLAPRSARNLRARMLRVFGAHTLGNLVTLADRFLLLPIMLYVWGRL